MSKKSKISTRIWTIKSTKTSESDPEHLSTWLVVTGKPLKQLSMAWLRLNDGRLTTCYCLWLIFFQPFFLVRQPVSVCFFAFFLYDSLTTCIPAHQRMCVHLKRALNGDGALESPQFDPAEALLGLDKSRRVWSSVSLMSSTWARGSLPRSCLISLCGSGCLFNLQLITTMTCRQKYDTL